jgi:hypothetical protein
VPIRQHSRRRILYPATSKYCLVFKLSHREGSLNERKPTENAAALYIHTDAEERFQAIGRLPCPLRGQSLPSAVATSLCCPTANQPTNVAELSCDTSQLARNLLHDWIAGLVSAHSIPSISILGSRQMRNGSAALSPTAGPPPGALAGEYVGTSADGGMGLGAGVCPGRRLWTQFRITTGLGRRVCCPECNSRPIARR